MNSIWAFIVVVIIYSIGLASAFYAGIRKGVEATLDIITSDNKNALMDLISDADKADVRGPEGVE